VKLIVLGATGGIGLEIVRQATEHGHRVTAFVRAPERLRSFGDRITVLQGDVLNAGELERAISGHDVILSGFGARVPVSKNDHNLLSRFAEVLTLSMQRSGVKRAVVVSTAFLFKDSVIPPTYLFGRLFFPDVVVDASEMEKILWKGAGNLTIVRPPRLTDKPRTGRYRVREGHLPVLGFNISRADVADAMIKTAENATFIGKVIGVSN
jgi:putative NADH-flavin reductase